MDNLEQIEAKQAEVHRETEAFYKTLGADDKAKLDAVGIALDTLAKAGVPATLVAEVPCYATKENNALVFHNWDALFNPEGSIDFDKKRGNMIHNRWVHYSRATIGYLAMKASQNGGDVNLQNGIDYLIHLAQERFVEE
jgi:hypothetical protein